MRDRRDAGAADYSLALSEQELLRYRTMAAIAADNEAAEWAAAGIVAGAQAADVGCGPGAMLRMLAERVGAAGQAVGIDADPEAVAVARQQIAGLPQGRAEVGQADATSLEPGGYDVVMCRHVLAHNGGREADIVAHLASLAPRRPCLPGGRRRHRSSAYRRRTGPGRPGRALPRASPRQGQRPVGGPAPR